MLGVDAPQRSVVCLLFMAMRRLPTFSLAWTALAAALGCQGPEPTPVDQADPPVRPPSDAEPVAAIPSAAEPGAAADLDGPVTKARAEGTDAPPSSPSPTIAVQDWAKRPARLAVGRTHVCVLDSSNHPVCWGDPREGRTGSPKADQDGPVQLASITVTSLAAGDSHTCGIEASGKVMCWGSNMQDQLDIEGAMTTSPSELALGSGAHQLSARDLTTCATSRDHGISCWSSGESVHHIEASDPLRVAVGPQHRVCMLDGKGTASCWGGAGTTAASRPKPVGVKDLPPSTDIGVGEGYACALGRDGRVRCWGSNEGGRLGLPTSVAEQPTPTVVPDLPDEILQLSVGHRSSCAVQLSGAVWCWGAGAEGQLGRGTGTAVGTAARVRGLELATEVAVAHERACALAKDGIPWCWGLRPGAPAISSTQADPAQRVALSDIEQCATTPDGRVGCWDLEHPALATFVEGLKGVSDLALPDFGGCAVVDGRARCWGSGAATARRRDHDSEDKTVRNIAVEGIRNIDAIMERVCVIDGQAHVWCWGWASPPDGSGEAQTFGPSRIAELDEAERLALSRFNLDCARRSDGTLACWTPAHTPKRRASRAAAISGVPPVVAIDGDQKVCAVTTTNEIWCVDEERSPAKLPVVLPAPASDIATAIEQTCVLLEDHGIACWRAADAEMAESPIAAIRVHGLDDIEQLVAKAERICAVARGGSSSCWVTPPPGIDDVPTPWLVFDGYSTVQ
jgi:hypothetical protein